MKIVAKAQTHPGLTRHRNEDAFLIDEKEALFVVADGMGGHNAGETASRLAVKHASHLLGQLPAAAYDNPLRIIEGAIREINGAIYDAAQKDRDYEGMGAALIIAWIDKSKCFLGHVGDVRGYLFRKGALRQLTRDHTIMATLVERGHLSAEDARRHPFRHRLERAVGVLPMVDPDLNSFDFHERDRLLLCSDGLWDILDDREIEIILGKYSGTGETCMELLQGALDAGGKDNITIVVVDAV